MATILIESFADAKYKWYPVTDSAAQHQHHRHHHHRSEDDESPKHRRESGASESETTVSIENGVGIMDGEVKVVE